MSTADSESAQYEGRDDEPGECAFGELKMGSVLHRSPSWANHERVQGSVPSMFLAGIALRIWQSISGNLWPS